MPGLNRRAGRPGDAGCRPHDGRGPGDDLRRVPGCRQLVYRRTGCACSQRMRAGWRPSLPIPRTCSMPRWSDPRQDLNRGATWRDRGRGGQPFHREGRYHLEDGALDGAAMVDRLAAWLDAYPIASLRWTAEDDWDHWRQLRARVGSRVMVMGDDCCAPIPRGSAGGRAGGGERCCQGQPDRHAERGSGRLPPGGRRRLARGDQRGTERKTTGWPTWRWAGPATTSRSARSQSERLAKTTAAGHRTDGQAAFGR